MEPTVLAWSIALIVATGLLPVGLVRVLAYRAGVDRTPGMRNVAAVALGLGLLALACFLVLTVVLLV